MKSTKFTLFGNTRKTDAVSSAPPKGLTGFFLPWRRASASFALVTTELLLIFPAVLFMAALFVRNLQPLQYQPAHLAAQIVNWYATHPTIALWGALITLPLAVLLIGTVTLVLIWNQSAELRQAAGQTMATISAHWATLVVAASTTTAAGILGIVALHMMAD